MEDIKAEELTNNSKKSKTHNQEIRARIEEEIAKYQNYNKIYTDGSKSSNLVGCAAVTSTRVISCKLPDKYSALSSELYAIITALDYILKDSECKFLILTDSKLALSAIENVFYSGNPLALDIVSIVTIPNLHRRKLLYFAIAYYAVGQAEERRPPARSPRLRRGAD